MSDELRGYGQTRYVLATDLDGTLIPLAGNTTNRFDLATIRQKVREHDVTLTFVTGRHLESVERAIAEYSLPAPDWIICDVGTTIFECAGTDDRREVVAYRSHLGSIISSCPIAELREVLSDISVLRLQEPEKQGRFKLSYYTAHGEIGSVVPAIEERLAVVDAPYSVIHSIDPFTGDGLIDLLPQEVSKAYALEWWVDHAGLPPESVVFAGDSGNDLAAFVAGYRTIVVGNTDREIARQVSAYHQQQGWRDRLCLAEEHGTSGVLEGCRCFGILS